MKKDTSALLIIHNGETAMMINEKTLDKQQAWGNLDTIKELHKARLSLEDLMKSTDVPSILRACDNLYAEIEFALQDAWLFPRDANYHRVWNRPKCKCPKMDNDDAYPSGYRYVAGNCPLHGMEDENETEI